MASLSSKQPESFWPPEIPSPEASYFGHSTDTAPMATLDILILIVLSIGLLRGWRSGFLKQATSLVGTLLAFVLAASFMESVGTMIASGLRVSPEQAGLIGFMALFVIVKLSVNMIAKAASSLLEATNLSGLDRAAGGFTGAAKAAVALSLFFVVVGFAQLPGEVSREESDFYMPVYQIVPTAWTLLADRSTAFGDLLKKVEDRLEFDAGSWPI